MGRLVQPKPPDISNSKKSEHILLCIVLLVRQRSQSPLEVTFPALPGSKKLTRQWNFI